MRATVLLVLFVGLAGCIVPPTATVSEPLGQAGQKWSPVEKSPQMVAFFRGTFDVLNFTVTESGERFYLVFGEDKVRVMGGRSGHADLDVPISQAHIDAVAKLGGDGAFDEQDAFSVMQILYGPIARAFLTGSFLNNEIIRKMAGVESLIHIVFWTPGRPETSAITLKAEGDQWNVYDGLVGKPQRVFRLDQSQTLEYMRRVHTTRKSPNPTVWLSFVNWYSEWRDRVSVAPAAG